MNDSEKKVVHSMLLEIKKLAYQASLTGAFKKSAPILATNYNKCLENVRGTDEHVVNFFEPLVPETCSIDEVGVAAALLASYLEPNKRRLIPHCENDLE